MKNNKTNAVLSRINGILLEDSSSDEYTNETLKFDNGYVYLNINGYTDKKGVFWFDAKDFKDILRETDAEMVGKNEYRLNGEYAKFKSEIKTIDGVKELMYCIDGWHWG